MTSDIANPEQSPRPDSKLVFMLTVAASSQDDEKGNAVLWRPLTASELNQIRQRCSLLASWLEPGRPAAVAEAVARMLVSFGGRLRTMHDAVIVTAGYVAALANLPLWAVEQACKRFAAGLVAAAEVEADHIDRSFPPSSAQLAIVVRALVSPLRDEERKLRRALYGTLAPPRPAPAPPPLPDPEQAAKQAAAEAARAAGVARVQAMLDEYHRAVAKNDLEAAQEEIRKAQIAAERKARNDQNIIDGYLAAGLPAPVVPPGGILVSLPMMLLCGWVIRKTEGGRAVLEKSSQGGAS